MRAASTLVVPVAEVPALLEPRDGWLLERPGPEPGSFEADGPFRTYQRRVTVNERGDGTAELRSEVAFEMAIPFWGPLFARPMAANLRPVRWKAPLPWWLPPARMDSEATTALSCLALLSVVTGYCGILLTQTLTFAADQFHSSTGAQGLALAGVRADFLIALALVSASDRRGRRWALLAASLAGCGFTALGALSPSLWFLAGSQVGARGALAGAGILIGIIAAEEMPAGARAYAISILAMAAALGAGTVLLLLFVADLDPGGWRVLFAVAFLGIPIVRRAGRRLPESRRFRVPHPDAPVVRHHGRRFWMLAVTAVLFALFFTPASQFTNEYLREERGFSASRISLFTIMTNLPGGIGIVVGGRLAERGRRLVGAIGVVGGVGCTVAMFLVTGWPLWGWSVIGSMLGAATVPALGVYGPELFPTAARGRANGLISGLGRMGSITGLIATGFLVDRLGTFGPALAILALGPAVVAALILIAYPETAHLELEDINPEDRIVHDEV